MWTGDDSFAPGHVHMFGQKSTSRLNLGRNLVKSQLRGLLQVEGGSISHRDARILERWGSYPHRLKGCVHPFPVVFLGENWRLASSEHSNWRS
jgi:hypothetical protein